jgi:AcrR family transcriptional regulator
MLINESGTEMERSVSLGNIEEVGSSHRVERSDAAANRVLILAAAGRLFEKRGISDVNMADIAAAAGVGKGTLYRRFNNKAELCLALMDSQMLDFQNRMLARMRRMTANGAPMMEQLDRFIDALVLFTEENASLLRVVQSHRLDEDIDGQQRPHFWLHMTVSGMLQTAIADGEIPDAVDASYAADAILSALRADLFLFQRRARGFSVARISRGLRTMVGSLVQRRDASL